MKRILYPARIESDNLGDVLINGLLIRELSKHAMVYLKGEPNKEIVNLIFERNQFKENIKVLPIDISSFSKAKIGVLKTLFRSIKFDFSFETPGHICSRPQLLNSVFKIFIDLSKILIYRIFGVKYVRFGVTLGPYRGIEWKFVKFISQISYKTVVRDEENYNLLNRKKISNIFYKPDLAFLLFQNPLIKNKSIEEKYQSDILLSFRGAIKGKGIEPLYFNLIKNGIISFLSKKNGLNLKLTHQVETDFEVNTLINKEINLLDVNNELCDEKLSFSDAVNYYSNAKIIVTNRLHVFLFAMCVGTITGIITDKVNHKKLVSILNDLNLGDVFIDKEKHSMDNEIIMNNFKKSAIMNKIELEEFVKSILC